MADEPTAIDEVRESAGHDDPSEPPPTSYPTNDLGKWSGAEEIGQPSVAQYPSGVMLMTGSAGSGMTSCGWDMGSPLLPGGMVMVPAEFFFKNQLDQSFWPWPAETWAATERLDLQDRSLGSEVVRKRKPRQMPRSRSQTWIGAARQVAEKRAALEAEEAKWPKLNESDSKKFRELPPKSIWRDVARQTHEMESVAARVRKEEQKSSPKDQKLPSNGEQKDVAEVGKLTVVVEKSKCDAEVQCELLTSCTEAESSRSYVCSNCGLASETLLPAVASSPNEKQSLTAEHQRLSALEHPDLSFWGPANDWAWDLDEACSKMDTCGSHPNDTVPTSTARRFPPAPAAPPPLPPAKELKCAEKGNRARRSCPTTPGGSSTTTAMRSDSGDSTASPSNPSPRSSADLTCQIPEMDFTGVNNITLPPASTVLETLVRKLNRLRKRCREMERLEERVEQGCTLNADQCNKASRLGSVKYLKAKIIRMEARIVRAAEGSLVSDSESDEEVEALESQTQLSTPDPNKNFANVRTISSSESCQTKTEDVAKSLQRRPAASSDSAGIQSGHKGKRVIKARTTVSNAPAFDTFDASLRDTNSAAALHVELAESGARRTLSRLASNLRVVASRLARWSLVCLAFAVVVAVALRVSDWRSSRQALGKLGVPVAMDTHILKLAAGSSSAWSMVAPYDADLNSKSQSIHAFARAEEIDIARAKAVVRQVITNIDTIKSKLKEEQREQQREKRRLQKEAGVDQQSSEEEQQKKSIQMQRWWRAQDEEKAKQMYLARQQQQQMMYMQQMQQMQQSHLGSTSSEQKSVSSSEQNPDIARQQHMQQMHQMQQGRPGWATNEQNPDVAQQQYMMYMQNQEMYRQQHLQWMAQQPGTQGNSLNTAGRN